MLRMPTSDSLSPGWETLRLQNHLHEQIEWPRNLMIQLRHRYRALTERPTVSSHTCGLRWVGAIQRLDPELWEYRSCCIGYLWSSDVRRLDEQLWPKWSSTKNWNSSSTYSWIPPMIMLRIGVWPHYDVGNVPACIWQGFATPLSLSVPFTVVPTHRIIEGAG